MLTVFYFLLRVGEYTKLRLTREQDGEAVRRATRTIQFAVKDTTFWKKGLRIDILFNPLAILCADEATMR